MMTLILLQVYDLQGPVLTLLRHFSNGLCFESILPFTISHHYCVTVRKLVYSDIYLNDYTACLRHFITIRIKQHKARIHLHAMTTTAATSIQIHLTHFMCV